MSEDKSEDIVGTCTEMCPDEEIEMRQRERLLHVLEVIPAGDWYTNPKADRALVVKAYSRSAAGQPMQESKNLRTPDALLKTINYLLVNVITIRALPWHVLYDFIMDRLLAVRQDMVIQRLSTAHCISILQPIIRFHAYAAYKLCEETVRKFDAVMNNRSLQECLKKLLLLYDECDEFRARSLNVSNVGVCVNKYEELFANSRTNMEALYVLFNLGNASAIDRALKLPKECKTGIVETALRISLSSRQGNWVRVCRLISDLPTILAGIAALHLPNIRRKALEVMATSYNCPDQTYPAEELLKLLLYSRKYDLISDCRHYNVVYYETSNVICFDKEKFNRAVVTRSPRHENFVSDKLCLKSVPSLVLYGEI